MKLKAGDKVFYGPNHKWSGFIYRISRGVPNKVYILTKYSGHWQVGYFYIGSYWSGPVDGAHTTIMEDLL